MTNVWTWISAHDLIGPSKKDGAFPFCLQGCDGIFTLAERDYESMNCWLMTWSSSRICLHLLVITDKVKWSEVKFFSNHTGYGHIEPNLIARMNMCNLCFCKNQNMLKPCIALCLICPNFTLWQRCAYGLSRLGNKKHLVRVRER